MTLYGAVEAGGTKIVCLVGSGPADLRAEARFPTTLPEANFAQIVEFFHGQQRQHGPLAALGIGSFGPLDLHASSPTYGYITATPKPGWSNVDVVGPLRQALGVPVGFDTDVNAAALGEACWGAAQDLECSVYLTVGTGIGGGCVVRGQPLHGLIHPEMGHIRVPHDWAADPFPGGCPFHGDCLEGLATGPALEQRWGQPADTLPPDHPAWRLEAHYLAQAVANYVLTLSPQRVILGGGVMQQAQLFPLIRAELQALLNGYVQSPAVLHAVDSYVVPPQLGQRAGVLGALALAVTARSQA